MMKRLRASKKSTGSAKRLTEVESTLAVEPEEVASSWTTAEEVASSWSLHPALGDKVSDLAPEPRLHAHVRGRRARGGERLDVLGRGHQLVPLDESLASASSSMKPRQR